jgi:hypothetical protein
LTALFASIALAAIDVANTTDILTAANGGTPPRYFKMNMLTINEWLYGNSTGEARTYRFDNAANKNGTAAAYMDYPMVAGDYNGNDHVLRTLGRQAAVTTKPDADGAYGFAAADFIGAAVIDGGQSLDRVCKI